MKPAFSVKSAHLDALSIQLQDHVLDNIRQTLHEQHSNYLKFKALPFILDAQQIEDGETLPLAEILALFAEHELKVIGLRHTDVAWENYAKTHNLVFFPEKITPSASESAEKSDTPSSENTENTETVAENAQATENNGGQPENPAATEEDAADAFARELFGESDDDKQTDTPSAKSEAQTTEQDDDILANDNSAIKTVEMAKPAELVELSPEEAQKLAEANSTELTSEDGEAKGEIVSISEAKQTIVVSTPVRTGQQIYAEKADLIVLGIVSPGAEVIADGNIHIYAPLRGRALAGASGDRKARIFVQSMQAELVSIAGIYRTFEQKLPNHLAKQAVRIELQDDRLAISSIVAE